MQSPPKDTQAQIRAQVSFFDENIRLTALQPTVISIKKDAMGEFENAVDKSTVKNTIDAPIETMAEPPFESDIDIACVKGRGLMSEGVSVILSVRRVLNRYPQIIAPRR